MDDTLMRWIETQTKTQSENIGELFKVSQENTQNIKVLESNCTHRKEYCTEHIGHIDTRVGEHEKRIKKLEAKNLIVQGIVGGVTGIVSAAIAVLTFFSLLVKVFHVGG